MHQNDAIYDALVSLWLTLNSFTHFFGGSIVDFEQVNAFCVINGCSVLKSILLKVLVLVEISVIINALTR